jgi:hypothetical protein
MKKIEILITDETGNIQQYNITGLLQSKTPMNLEDSYRYNAFCARATLYPNKTIGEVNTIIENNIKLINS